MAKEFYDDLRLGILGGGQLGRMLIQEAINYNVSISVLDPDHNAPSKRVAHNFEVGDISNYDDVYNFGKGLDVLTIEIEKVNVAALSDLEEEGVLVYPQSRVIHLIQDKGLQKQFFKQNDIPTSKFQFVSSKVDLKELNLDFPYVQKLRKDGYDGKGVKIIRSIEDLDQAFDEPSIIEDLVDFKKEVAVIVVRNDKGEVTTFPMVEMEFNKKMNLVEFLISPSLFSEGIQQRAEEIAKKIANDLQIVGLLAVEMFLTKDDEILVNELAPRPHNSGHQTIEGNKTSQFNQHLRAILTLPLGDTSSISNAVMINLLGEDGCDGLAKYHGIEEVLKISGVYVHLYGKKYTKPFRKMGHVTIVHEDRDTAVANARRVQEILKVKA